MANNNNNIATALLILALAAPAAVYAADHVVGGSTGWSNSGFNYSSWAAGETFVVGDKLVFNYGGNHSVAEVPQADYTSCSASNTFTVWTGGSTTILLIGAGNQNYICTTSADCASGMKLSINVVAASSGTPPTTPTTPTTPPTPTTPSGGGGGSTTPPATTTPPPPSNSNSPSGARSLFPNLNNLMLPSLMLLLGAAVAAMG